MASVHLKMTVVTLGYYKVCARCVPQMLTQEQKQHCMHIFRDMLIQYEGEGDSFQDPIITRDETPVVSTLQARVTTAVHGVVTCEFPTEEKVQGATLSR